MWWNMIILIYVTYFNYIYKQLQVYRREYDQASASGHLKANAWWIINKLVAYALEIVFGELARKP